MEKNLFKEMVVEAYRALHDVGEAAHDPLSGHRLADAHKQGKSWFIEGIDQTTTAIALLDSAVLVHPLPGRNGAICFVAVIEGAIGVDVPCRPVAGAEYTLKKVHGELQPVGPGETSQTETSIVTYVLSPVNGMYVLASVHPGYPDTGNALPDNWVEGQIVDADQLHALGITRVVAD